MKSPLLPLLSALGMAALLPLLSGCNASSTASAATPAPVTGLTLSRSTEMSIPAIVKAVGTVRSAQSATVSAQVSGRILAVLVHEGDRVSAGQPLARIDDTLEASDVARIEANQASARDAVTAAQSQADLAASTLARYQILRDRKSVSPQEFDEVSHRAEAAQSQLQAARSQLAAAQAGLASARTMAGYAVVKAPFAGVVTARHLDPGALAAPGLPILELDKAGPLQLQVSVDESQITAVHPAQRIPIQLDGSAVQQATIAEILPAADPASHSFLVKLALPGSPTLRAGVYGTAFIPTGLRSAILVPTAAVVRRGSLACAYVLDTNGIAQLRYLTLGAPQGDQIEVLSGLSAGETLVNNPGDRDLAGHPVIASDTNLPAETKPEVRR